MVHEVGDNGRVVHIDKLAFLDVRSSADSVIRVEIAGVDSGDDILSGSGLARAKLGKGLAEVESVVLVGIAVRVRNDVIGVGCRDLDRRVGQVDLQYVHPSGDVLELHTVVVAAWREEFLLHGLPKLVLSLHGECSAHTDRAHGQMTALIGRHQGELSFA